MKTKKKKRIFSHKCDYCNRELTLNGPESDTYVINAEYKYFCINQTPGKPAEKDCLTSYLQNRKKYNELPIKKRLEEEEEETEEEKAKRQEEKKRVIPRLNAYLQELKQKQFKNRHK